eukprot:PhM_4_TR18457/c0_g1_i1/m.17610
MSINSSTITIPLSNPLQSLDMRIKFRLHRRSGVEARRIRGDYTFEQLHAVVSQWWDHAHVCWQYADPIDTDDVVTLSSHPEWVECVAIHRDAGKHLITIDVRRANKTERKAAAAAAVQKQAAVVDMNDVNKDDVEDEASFAVAPYEWGSVHDEEELEEEEEPDEVFDNDGEESTYFDDDFAVDDIFCTTVSHNNGGGNMGCHDDDDDNDAAIAHAFGNPKVEQIVTVFPMLDPRSVQAMLSVNEWNVERVIGALIGE